MATYLAMVINAEFGLQTRKFRLCIFCKNKK